MRIIMGIAPVTEALAGIDDPCELDASQTEPEDEDEDDEDDEDEEYDDDEIEPEGMPHE
jgi:Ran GTPase-activating protein (RanGAP) involved in mRNA processing and transport